MKIIRSLLFAPLIALTMPSVSFGQAQQQPVVVTSTTSTGANVTQPVGNGAGTSVAMPVNCLSGCSGGGGGGNVNLTGINSVAPSVGNGTTNTGTQRVTLSSDSTGQIAVSQATPGTTNGVQTLSGSVTAASQSGTWNITNVSGTVSLPTGASTSALQTTGNTSLSTIATNTTNSGSPTVQPCAVSGCGTTPTISAINTTSLVVKNSAGVFFDGYCYSSAAGNCILYNATAAPAAGALTAALVLECIPVAANGYGNITYPNNPEVFSTGIVMLFSSGTGEAGCNTYTASSTAYLHGRAK